MNITPVEVELCTKIRQYALEHYQESGWDVLVECWDNSDILNDLIESKINPETVSLEDAIAAIASTLDVYDDRRKDIQAEVF